MLQHFAECCVGSAGQSVASELSSVSKPASSGGENLVQSQTFWRNKQTEEHQVSALLYAVY